MHYKHSAHNPDQYMYRNFLIYASFSFLFFFHLNHQNKIKSTHNKRTSKQWVGDTLPPPITLRTQNLSPLLSHPIFLDVQQHAHTHLTYFIFISFSYLPPISAKQPQQPLSFWFPFRLVHTLTEGKKKQQQQHNHKNIYLCTTQYIVTNTMLLSQLNSALTTCDTYLTSASITCLLVMGSSKRIDIVNKCNCCGKKKIIM